jgi:hypothetical protein
MPNFVSIVGYSTGYRTRFEKRDSLRRILVVCGGVFPLVWRLYSSALGPDLLLKIYVFTVPLFGWMLASEYPPLASRWFWKAMIPILVMHSVALYGLVQATLYFGDIGVKLPTRMAWSCVTAAIFLEYGISLRIIRAFDPENRESTQKPSA